MIHKTSHDLTSQGIDECECLIDRFKLIARELEKHLWISIEDRLPLKGKVCLLYQTFPANTIWNCRADPFPRQHIRIGGLRYNGIFVSYEDQYSDEGLKHVTHWMSLPTPPKK